MARTPGSKTASMTDERYKLHRLHYNTYRAQPKYRAYENMRRRSRDCLKRRSVPKFFTTAQIMGGTYLEMAHHLETQFKPFMNWDNYGTVWVIDHVLPIAMWDLSQPAQQLMAFNMHNLQPLTPNDNTLKGSTCDLDAFGKLSAVANLYEHAVNSDMSVTKA